MAVVSYDGNCLRVDANNTIFRACLDGSVYGGVSGRAVDVSGLAQNLYKFLVDLIKRNPFKFEVSDGDMLYITHRIFLYVGTYYPDEKAFSLVSRNLSILFSDNKVSVNEFIEYGDFGDLLRKLLGVVFAGKVDSYGFLKVERSGDEVILSYDNRDILSFDTKSCSFLDSDFVYLFSDSGDVDEYYRWLWDVYRKHFGDMVAHREGNSFNLVYDNLTFRFDEDGLKIIYECDFRIEASRKWFSLVYKDKKKVLKGEVWVKSAKYYDMILNDKRKDRIIRAIDF